MGKRIRHTMIITITETWTIVWTLDDDPTCHPASIVQDKPNPKEEPDETLQTTLSDAELGQSHTSDRIAPLTPAAAPAPQPDRAPTRPTASGRSRRTRRRRSAASP